MSTATLAFQKSMQNGLRIIPERRPEARRIPAPPARPKRGLFRRAQPTAFQRCLALHMHSARPVSALD
jgi:hypothetical protein